ncbi:MAG: portal protein [Alphaproteobacteria bacterium]|nr:portal protein [Alphaproteobacteria bacterium]
MPIELIEQAKKKLKCDQSAWNDIYKKAEDDLHFLSDDEFAQWDQQDYLDRINTKRPALTVDQLGQFIHQVANDIRMNTPTINVIPSDEAASVETADVIKGLIREIEYRSNADDVYDTASLSSIKCGIGFMRVEHDYSDDGVNQVLSIKRIVNPLAVWIDSESIECDGRDAKHGTILEPLSVDKFKETYPDFEPICFESDSSEPKKDGLITIAEHFYITEAKETVLSEDGLEEHEITKKTVHRVKLSGADILEETTFPGEYIPIVPVYGEEHWVKGERHLFSLIRKSKSAQRMFNYWKSLETELLMKAPQAPVMAAEGQVENYIEEWKQPNKAMVLRYKVKDLEGNAVGSPVRLEPPPIPVGVVNASRQCVDDIKATMGIYNAGLGAIDNAISGVAIQKRQGEGDVATYHFADNLVRSITHVGRILVSAISIIYDTPRIINIITAEDETKPTGINGAIFGDQEQTFDLSRGKYDVRVITGASFTTKRQEAAQFLSGLVQSNPEFIKIMGDILFKNMDFAGAPAMAERIKKVMNPDVLSDDKVDPLTMQLQAQLQQSQALAAALQEQLNNKQAELALKARAEENDAEQGKAEMQVKMMELSAKNDLALAELDIKKKELALKEQELLLKRTQLQAGAMQRIAETNSAPLT